MHRSGTSLAADVLVRLGVHLGPPDRALATAPRPNRGYWEIRDVVDLDHAILLAMGGASWDPPPLAPGWENDARLEQLVGRARTILSEQFSAEPSWGFKGPIVSLTLPVWRRAAGELQYVVCVRSPAGCAASLVTRDPSGPLSRADFGGLWLHYYALLLQYLREERVTWLFFEDWPSDAAAQVDALAATLGERAPPAAERARIAGAFRPDLQHHMTDVSAAVADAGVPPEATALWGAMRWLLAGGAVDASRQAALADLALRLWGRVDPRAAEAWSPAARAVRPAPRPPRATVVLPVRNPDAAELEATIATAADQDLHDLEIVVVDDASRNGAVARATELDWRVRLVRHRVPRGRALARLSGRRAARGSVVLDLALGERWERDRVRRLVDASSA